MKVSVIITTRNRSGLLIRAIESVLKQTHRSFELIVVDDDSTDDTAQVIEPYRQAGQLFYLPIAKAASANAARSEGLKQATGEAIAFLDDDDYWFEKKLERQVAHLVADPAVALVGCWFEKDRQVIEVPTAMDYQKLLASNSLGGFSMGLMRAAALKNCGGLDLSLSCAQDWDIWLSLARMGKVVIVPESLMYYETGQVVRISSPKNPHTYYDSYLRVVRKHAGAMAPWTRRKHEWCSRYHTSKGLKRFLGGVRYAVAKYMERVAA